MEFDSHDNVEEFYTLFAKKEGFGARIRWTKEKICMLVYSNEGIHIVKTENGKDGIVWTEEKKRYSTSRTGCKASFFVSKAWKRYKWVIKSKVIK